MIGNFQIDTFTEQDLIDLGYRVMISKWDDKPVNSLFTSNTENGERFLRDFGSIYEFVIIVEEIESVNIAQYVTLSGSIVDFLEDVGDTRTHQMNCIVESKFFNGRPLFNSVAFILKSEQPAHETSDRRQVINPICLGEEDQRFFELINDADGETFLKYSE